MHIVCSVPVLYRSVRSKSDKVPISSTSDLSSRSIVGVALDEVLVVDVDLHNLEGLEPTSLPIDLLVPSIEGEMVVHERVEALGKPPTFLELHH